MFRSLFSTVYSHAIYCAKAKNTQTLVNDLLPIYKKRNDPINFDNGKEIMAIANNNPFVAIVHEIEPFKFSSSEEYFKVREQVKKNQAERAKETPEQKKLRIKSNSENMLKRVSSWVDLDQEDQKINDAIDAVSQKIEGYKLTNQPTIRVKVSSTKATIPVIIEQ